MGKFHRRPRYERDNSGYSYYKTNHWKETRARIPKRDKHCRIYWRTKKLSTPHRLYFNERDEDLVILCWDCHEAWEAYCKGIYASDEMLERARTLLSSGLSREEAVSCCVDPGRFRAALERSKSHIQELTRTSESSHYNDKCPGAAALPGVVP